VSQRGGPALRIEVRDTIRPPLPVVISEESGPGFTLYHVRQTTDAFLDSPARAGRPLEAYIAVPTAAGPHPVRLQLHGFSPAPATLRFGSPSEIIIHPQDLENTYWWGYSEQLPGEAAPEATVPKVPNYSQRRALHLLEWALERFAGDAERVHVQGASMGGAGAATLGLLYARHFAWVRSRVGQMIPRNHRPERIAQLAGFWGPPAGAHADEAGSGRSVWDRMDLSRALHEDPEAREQFLLLKHSKDDRIIHFGAVTQPSPLTGESFYASLQSQKIGHLAVWDEGGHMSPDPQLGAQWWDEDWDPDADERTYLRRNLAFPAFSSCSADGNPGTGRSRDGRAWHARAGYAGQVAVPGDTGWDGDVRGVLNRNLRWDSASIIDSFDHFEIRLGLGGPSPLPQTTVQVDVTLRRCQRFAPAPGEALRYRFGQSSGSSVVGPEGLVSIPALALGAQWETLRIERAELCPGSVPPGTVPHCDQASP
jgi:hypothetical protein